MITEAVLAVRFDVTVEDLTATFHPYLTLSEGVKLSAQAFMTDLAKLSCCAAWTDLRNRTSRWRAETASGP